MPKIDYTFPRNFPVNGEVANLLRTCCRLVSDTTNKSATSWQQVVVMEFGKRHDTTQQTQRTFARANYRTCYGLAVYVADLLRTCYGKTGVMDFWSLCSCMLSRYSRYIRLASKSPQQITPTCTRTDLWFSLVPAECNLFSIERPRAKDHLTPLLVEREILDIDDARALVDRDRNPEDLSVVVDDSIRLVRHLVLSVSAIHTPRHAKFSHHNNYSFDN